MFQKICHKNIKFISMKANNPMYSIEKMYPVKFGLVQL